MTPTTKAAAAMTTTTIKIRITVEAAEKVVNKKINKNTEKQNK